MEKKINTRFQIALVVLTGAIAYLPMLKNGFTWYSDNVYVLQNEQLQNLNSHSISLFFTSYFDGHYHPFTMLSLAVNYAIHGTDPAGYQITNFILFLLCSVMVLFVVKELTRNNIVSFFTVLLFSVHPVHVESVCRITERKDLLYGLFFLMALYYYIRYIDQQKKNKLVIATVLFIFSILSKGQAVAFPVVLILVDFYRKREFRKLSIWTEKIHFFALSLFFGYLTIKAQVYTGYINDFPGMVWYEPFLHAFNVLTLYLYRTIIPVCLSPHYPYPYNPGEAIPSVIYLFILIIPALCFFLYRFRKKVNVVFGMLFYLVTVILMLRAIPVADNYSPDRYNFIPSIGLFLIISSLAFFLYQKFNGKIILIFSVYIVALLIVTFRQTRVWHDGVSVWTRALECDKKNIPALQNLAEFYLKSEEKPKAVDLYKQILKEDSSNTHTNYYYIQYLISSDLVSEAVMLSEKLEKINYSKSSDLNNMALIKSSVGDMEKALEYILGSLKMNSHQPKIWQNLASLLAMQYNYTEAAMVYKYCMNYPVFSKAELYQLCAKSLLFSGKTDESKIYIEKACNLQPDNVIYKNTRDLINKISSDYEPDVMIDSLFAVRKAEFFIVNGTEFYAIPYLKWLLERNPADTRLKDKLSECIARSGTAKDNIELIRRFGLQTDKKITDYYISLNSIRNVFSKY